MKNNSTPQEMQVMDYPESAPINFKRQACLLATGACLPKDVVTNQQIIDRHKLIVSDRAVQFSIGISERRQVDDEVATSQYLYEAALDCLSNAGIAPSKLSRIIFAKLMGDQYIPSNSSKVLEKLNIGFGIPVMDISAACSGFAHALEMALSFINGGEDYILILTGEKAGASSNTIATPDTRTIFLNGDGFAAALIGPSDKKKFLAHYFYTDSSIRDFAYIPFGTTLLDHNQKIVPESFLLTMPNGPKIHQSVLDSCRTISGHLLKQSGLSLENIDFFITSDQTTLVWKAQLELLGIPEEKSLSCFHKYGNTVAAMVNLNLHEAIQAGKLKKGMTVMMMAHGAGASGGGFIFEY